MDKNKKDLLNHLRDCVECGFYFEIDPSSAKTLLEIIECGEGVHREEPAVVETPKGLETDLLEKGT